MATAPVKSVPVKDRSRPLSPHLQIYRPQITSVLSITHRMTGLALSIGIAFFVWWLVAAAAGPEAYAVFSAFCGSGFGQFLLFGWSLCLFYHLASGIRHLFWDIGLFLDLKGAYATGYLVLAFTVLATGALWGWIWCVR